MARLKKNLVKPIRISRDNLHSELRNKLIKRDLEPDSRIIESQLSEQLGISRTPLREALFKLEREGFIRSDLAKGFTVNPLSSKEVKELYPIIWTLEGLAIRLAVPYLPSIVKDLKGINQELAKATSAEKIIAIDTRFHDAITQTCRNKHLINQLAILKHLAQRYEYAYMQDSNWVEDSIEQHNQIIEALSKKNFDLAIKVIEQNWRLGMDRISTWLDWI